MIRTRSIREEFALLLLLTVIIAAVSYEAVRLIKLPAKKAMEHLGEVPVAWELKVRDAVKHSIAADNRVVENEFIDSTMTFIIERLTKSIHDTTYPITVMVVESDMVNAVTFPGGLIVVFTPLIRLATSPEEVAGVLAHEIGHI
jgi:predicted Zn-dependent protease